MEIFGPVFQGEGSVIGMQTMFIRFGGCDYRCVKCDSMHAVDPELVHKNARWLTAGEIIDELYQKHKSCEMVTLSGGNPLIWDLTDLVKGLVNNQWTIAVETQGTIWRPWIKKCDYITISPKGPGMGEQFDPDKFAEFWHASIGGHAKVSVKIVIFDERDIELAKQIATQYQNPLYKLYLSLGNPYPPGKDELLFRDSLRLDLLDRMEFLEQLIIAEPALVNARFLPQLHVLVHGNKQGK